MNEKTFGTLEIGEFHPAAQAAMSYVKLYTYSDRIGQLIESFSSCAMSGNRLAEVCLETLNRVMRGDPVSDRYLLGLAWTIKEIEERNDGEVIN